MHRLILVNRQFNAIVSDFILVDLRLLITICFLLSSQISLVGQRKDGIRRCG